MNLASRRSILCGTFLAAATIAVGCSSAPEEATLGTSSAISMPKCAANQHPVCTTPGDPGDGVKAQMTCTCEDWTIWDVTNPPHDTTYVHDATMSDPHPPQDFVTPSKLVTAGCTDTVIFYNNKFDVPQTAHNGGRLWACPPDKISPSIFPLPGSWCTGRLVYKWGTSMGGAPLGDTFSGWEFVGEECTYDPPLGGQACHGPCAISCGDGCTAN